MKLLLDTHAFLWLVEGSDRLSRPAAAAIREKHNTLFLSVASVWEMAIKIGKRKLSLNQDLESFVSGWTNVYEIELLPIETKHAIFTSTLKGQHGDPFDRMLIAQSIIEKMALVSGDRIMPEYQVSIIW